MGQAYALPGHIFNAPRARGALKMWPGNTSPCPMLDVRREDSLLTRLDATAGPPAPRPSPPHARGRRSWPGDRRWPSIDAPGERLLDVGLGVADQLAEKRQHVGRDLGSRPRRRSMWGIVAIVLPTRRRSQRDGLKTSCSSSPSGRLEEEPLPPGGPGVDRDPVAGLRAAAGAAATFVGSARQEPLERSNREPARLELGLAEQAVGEEQQARPAICANASRKPRFDGLDQRPADAVARADPGRDVWPSGTRDRRARAKARPRGASRRVGIGELVRERLPERLGPGSRAATNATACSVAVGLSVGGRAHRPVRPSGGSPGAAADEADTRSAPGARFRSSSAAT